MSLNFEDSIASVALHTRADPATEWGTLHAESAEIRMLITKRLSTELQFQRELKIGPHFHRVQPSLLHYPHKRILAFEHCGQPIAPVESVAIAGNLHIRDILDYDGEEPTTPESMLHKSHDLLIGDLQDASIFPYGMSNDWWYADGVSYYLAGENFSWLQDVPGGGEPTAKAA